MGLLRNKKFRNTVSSLLFSKPWLTSILLYAAGVVWLFSLNHPDMSKRTYFSENALLPGLVDSKLDAFRDADKYYKQYSNEMETSKKSDYTGINWIEKEMEAIGLEVYSQRYNFSYPMDMLRGQTVHAENLYAILRSPRGASTEAFVITAPLRPKSAGLPVFKGSVAAMLGLAKAMSRFTFWSRDIVFVLTENEYVGIQAWLDGYIGEITSKYINAARLEGSIGYITAALNLEITEDRFEFLNIKTEGFNGQLPNLDLVNLVTRLCEMNQVQLLHHRDHTELSPQDMNEYIKISVLTSSRMVFQQATGMVSGNHGHFLRYRIEAVTIESVSPTSRRPHGFQSLTKIVEGITRSVNNLLERFHQSFFFYLLPDLHSYISIGVYIPPFALMTSALLVQALSLYFGFYTEVWFRNRRIREKKDQAFTAEGKFSHEMTYLLNLPDTISGALPGLSAPLFIALFTGYGLYSAPEMFSVQELKDAISHEAVVLGMLGIWISAVLLIMFTFTSKDELRQLNWQVLKSLSLVAHGLLLFSVSLINVSFSILLGMFTIPFYCYVKPVSSWIGTALQALLLLICSPPGLIILLSYIHNLIEPSTTQQTPVFNPSEFLGHVHLSCVATIIDNLLFKNYLFTLLCMAVHPIWILMWSVIWIRL